MSETGYTDEGFVTKDVTEILVEKENEAIHIFDQINRSISDLLWQWMKIVAMERVEQEVMHETGADMMSLENAVGQFLDKHGIEAGIERKGATKSEGRVDVTANIQGISILVPEGTRFTSGLNNYISDDDNTIPYTLTMTKDKTGVSQDFFPTDISQVAAIEEIQLGDGTIVSTSFYSLDSVYNNNIIWTGGSSSFITEDEEYIVRFIGNVTKRVEISSEFEGPDTVALENKLTTCIDFPSLVCLNTEPIDGGADEEEDIPYRERISDAKRRTFTLGKIKDIVLGLDAVRATKVFQDVGTDQSSIADWDNPSRGTDVKATGQQPLYSQNFVPGDNVATLGRITLYGEPIGNPPAIILGMKRNVDGFATGIYKDYVKLQKSEIDPTVIGVRDLEFNLKFNGLDKTKTYAFDIWVDDPGVTGFDWANNYWLIATSAEIYRTDSRGMYRIWNGNQWVDQGNSIDLMFKTHWKGAGYTSTVAVNDGYGFDNTKLEIDELLDFVEGGGNSPICIQSQILEPTEILVDIRGTIFISELADFSNVRREIEEDIESYLEALGVGENILYSRIYQAIMDHAQIENLTDLEIKRQDVGSFDELDLAVQDDEIADVGTTSFNQG